MGEGLQRAFGAAAATDLKPAQVTFLRALSRWQGVASSRDLGPQTSQEENSARQRCKRRGLVTYDGHYWRLTDIGRQALRHAQYKRQEARMDRTRYSDEIKGERGNYNWPVCFDHTDNGYLGITQKEDGHVKDRVLLSPKQVKELVAFVQRKGRP